MKKMLETKKLAFLQLLLSAVMTVLVVMHWIFADVFNNGFKVHIYNFKGAETPLIIINIFLIILGILAAVVGGFQSYVAIKIERDRNYRVVGLLSGVPQTLSVIPYVHGFTTTLSFILNVLIYLDMIKPKYPKTETSPKNDETKEEKPEAK